MLPMLNHRAAHMAPNFPSEMIPVKKKPKKNQNLKSLTDFGEITDFSLLFWEKGEVEEIRIKLKKAGM